MGGGIKKTYTIRVSSMWPLAIRRPSKTYLTKRSIIRPKRYRGRRDCYTSWTSRKRRSADGDFLAVSGTNEYTRVVAPRRPDNVRPTRGEPETSIVASRDFCPTIRKYERGAAGRKTLLIASANAPNCTRNINLPPTIEIIVITRRRARGPSNNSARDA